MVLLQAFEIVPTNYALALLLDQDKIVDTCRKMVWSFYISVLWTATALIREVYIFTFIFLANP